MTNEIPPFYESVPECLFDDGCDAYKAHFEAESLKISARRQLENSKRAAQAGEGILARKFKDGGNSDSVASKAIVKEIGRMKRNQRLCINCPYNHP